MCRDVVAAGLDTQLLYLYGDYMADPANFSNNFVDDVSVILQIPGAW